MMRLICAKPLRAAGDEAMLDAALDQPRPGGQAEGARFPVAYSWRGAGGAATYVGHGRLMVRLLFLGKFGPLASSPLSWPRSLHNPSQTLMRSSRLGGEAQEPALGAAFAAVRPCKIDCQSRQWSHDLSVPAFALVTKMAFLPPMSGG